MTDVIIEPKDAVSMRRLRVAEAIRAIELGIHENRAPDFFHSLVRSLALTLRVEHALVSEFLGPKKWRVRTLGLWVSDHFGQNYEYGLYDTPCANVMKGVACYYPTSIQTMFPRDMDLKQLAAESYFGVPAKDSNGEVNGHLVIMDTKPLHDKPFLLTVLSYFAEHVGEEIDRRNME